MITTNCILQEVVWWFEDALERNPIPLDGTVLGGIYDEQRHGETGC